jgi:hypothetical protein
MRCTQATLEAFGIQGVCPIHGAGVTQALVSNGYKFRVSPWYFDRAFSDPKLGDFIKDHPTGAYVLSTASHSMALIDGVLTDTAQGTGRRKLLYALEITKA